jgi:hypothetical protein
MGTKSIRHIVESVLDTYLSAETGLAGVAIYTGDSNETNVLPKAIVVCDSARAPIGLPEGLGNYSCGVRITVFSNADDTTLSQHRARCAGLSGAMQDLTAIKAGFVTSGDATCYDVSPMSEDEGVAERSWATAFSYDVLVVLPPAA